MKNKQEKEFLILFALVFLVLSVLFSLWWSAGYIFLVCLLLKPPLIAPFYRVWMKLGTGLAIVVSPIALRLVYFVLLSPSFLIKLFSGLEYGKGSGFIQPDNRSSYKSCETFKIKEDY